MKFNNGSYWSFQTVDPSVYLWRTRAHKHTCAPSNPLTHPCPPFLFAANHQGNNGQNNGQNGQVRGNNKVKFNKGCCWSRQTVDPSVYLPSTLSRAHSLTQYIPTHKTHAHTHMSVSNALTPCPTLIRSSLPVSPQGNNGQNNGNNGQNGQQRGNNKVKFNNGGYWSRQTVDSSL